MTVLLGRRLVVVGHVILGGALFGACTFEAGSGFATLEEGSLTGELAPGGRGEGDTFLTDGFYRATLDALEVTVDRVAFETLEGGGGGGGVFDPANPPPGYTLCHAGHCHAEDGSLPTYEEIQAELAGGAATYEPVVTMPVAQPLDLLAGERRELGRVEPSKELPQTTLARVSVPVTALRIRGTVTEGALPDGASVELDVELPLDTALTTTVSRTIDRDHAPTIRPAVAIVVDGTLLDGIDFATAAEEGAVVVRDATDPAAEVIVTSLLDDVLEVTLR